MERRVTLALVLCLVVVFGYNWLLTKLKPSPPPSPTESSAPAGDDETPPGGEKDGAESSEAAGAAPLPDLVPATKVAPAEDFPVDNPDMRVVFSNRGASIRRILLKAPYLKHRSLPPGEESSWYPIVDTYHPDVLPGALFDPSGRIPLDKSNWEIVSPPGPDDDGGGRSIAFRYRAANGLVLEKAYSVPEKGFHVRLKLTVSGGAEPGTQYRLFLRGVGGMECEFPGEWATDGAVGAAFAYGAAAESLEFEVVTRGALHKAEKFRKEITRPDLRWVATLDKYFATVLMPEKPGEWLAPRAEGESGRIELTLDENALDLAHEANASLPQKRSETELDAIARTRVSTAVLFPFAAQLEGRSIERSFLLFAGPRDPHVLSLHPDYALFQEVVRVGFKGGCGLDFVVVPIAKLLLFLLEAIHSLVGNWGAAIILLTGLVRLVILPLSLRQQVVMTQYSLRMGKIKPEMEKLQQKYKTNKQRLNQELMKLYKEKGINPIPPLGGCLPLFITMPVFLGLFYVFSNSIVMRQSPFLWIDDLSQPDRLIPFGTTIPLLCFSLDAINVLPILMAATWWLQQKLAPKPTDPQSAQQQKMLQWMPFLFLFMLYGSAAGLSLYWFVNSVLGILETQFVRKRFMAPPPAAVPAPA